MPSKWTTICAWAGTLASKRISAPKKTLCLNHHLISIRPIRSSAHFNLNLIDALAYDLKGPILIKLALSIRSY